MSTDAPPRKTSGGSPKGDPALVRTTTIGVRVSPTEYVALREKAALMHMTPSQWLREAALSRFLPSPPMAAINREHYAALAHLVTNLNQLTRFANEGQCVTVADALLLRVSRETRDLRLALLGMGEHHDR